MGFGTNLLELLWRYPVVTEKTPTVDQLTQNASSKDVFAAAIATALFQNSVVRVKDVEATNGSANILVTPIPK